MSDVTEPVVGGVEEESLSTAQEAIPVPYIAGTRKVGVHWISNTYNQRSKEVSPEDLSDATSKKAGDISTGVYDYYGSIAAAVCMGSVDTLVSISFDGETVWAGNIERSLSPDPFVGTIVGYGTFKFYWGTDDQILESTSILKKDNNDKGEDHPDYKGTAILELIDILFGREKVTAPNVEIVVSRTPVQSLVEPLEGSLIDGQSNPVCAVLELMTNKRYGLGMDTTQFDQTSFRATANAIYLNSDLMYCSPFLNEQSALREVLAEMLNVSDSFLVWRNADAKIHAGHWSHGVSLTEAEVSALPSVVFEDMTESPDLESESWSGLPTGYIINFSDREKLYNRSSEKFEDLSLVGLVGQQSLRTLSRLWITRREQATAHATERVKTDSRPKLGGQLALRRRSADALNVGDLFKLDIDIEPSDTTTTTQICRVLEKSYEQVGAVGVFFLAETNLVPLTYTPDIVPPIDDAAAFPEPNAFVYTRPMEMPPSLSNTEYGIAVLAQRADNMTVGFGVLYDPVELTGSFPAVGSQRTFAVRASLEYAFADTDIVPTINTSVSNPLDLENFDFTPGDVSASADQFLLVLAEIDAGQIKNDASGFAEMEILSVRDMTLVAPYQYEVSAYRGRFSTGQRSFSAGAEAWLVRKASLNIYTHPDFSSKASSQEEIYFKTTPFNIFKTRDITKDPDPSVAFNFPVNRFFAPTITIDPADPGTPYAGVPYVVEGHIDDQDGDLSFWSVSYRVTGTGEQNEIVVAGGPIENTTQYNFKVPITFGVLDIGVGYDIIIRAKDSTTFIDSYVEETLTKTVQVAEAGLTLPPTDLATTGTVTADAMLRVIWLSWTAPLDVSKLEYFEVQRATDALMTDAEIIGTTGGEFFVANVDEGTLYYFQVRSRDVSGNFSAWTTAVSGNARLLIEDGDVLQITSAKIASLEAGKITTGTLSTTEMTLNSGSAAIQSSNFDSANGFKIDGLGDAAFSNLEVRGNAVVGTGADGLMFGQFSGSGAGVYVESPTTLDIDTSAHDIVRLYIKREASASDFNASIWFTTTGSSGWSSDKSVSFVTTGSESDFITVDIDMTTATSGAWGVTNLQAIRIYPASGEDTGDFYIGYVRIINEFSSVLYSWDFITTLDNWTATGTSTFSWAVGAQNTLQSANFVEGVSGWRIKGNGQAEFYQVSIYGSVALPQVFAGAAELVSGEEYSYLASVTLTISTTAGTTAYYRTDGLVPSGLPSEVVPASNQITLTSQSQLRVVAFEDTTSRSSDTFSAGILVSVPVLLNSLGTSGMYIRSFKDSSDRIIVGIGTDPSVISTWSYLDKATFKDVLGNPFGYQYGETTTTPWAPGSASFPKVWFCFASGSSISTRIGYWYYQDPDIFSSSSQMTGDIGSSVKVYSDNDANDLVATYSLSSGTFDTNDYPDVFA